MGGRLDCGGNQERMIARIRLFSVDESINTARSLLALCTYHHFLSTNKVQILQLFGAFVIFK